MRCFTDAQLVHTGDVDLVDSAPVYGGESHRDITAFRIHKPVVALPRNELPSSSVQVPLPRTDGTQDRSSPTKPFGASRREKCKSTLAQTGWTVAEKMTCCELGYSLHL